MRRLIVGAAVILSGVAWDLVPAAASPLPNSGFSSPTAQLVQRADYWRRQYRRFGDAVPYGYYPPAYGYYAPPPAYGYYQPYDTYARPPAYDDGDNSSADVDYGEYPANEEDSDYPPESDQ
jgi:hypothetical protein